MNRILSSILAVALLISLSSCGRSDPKQTELTVFAAASLTETLDQLKKRYESDHDITILCQYESSGTLMRQIEEGADCDLFLSASWKQVDKLIDEGYIEVEDAVDLLENQVVLVVPEGDPAHLTGFAELAQRLPSEGLLLAIGNEDVPVGQYTQKLFDYYDLHEEDLRGRLTYGSNVKEVTAQVSAGSVDAGIIYATDAAAAGLTVVDAADPSQCGQVLYPAAILSNSSHRAEAQDFLDYLTSEEAERIFAAAGFRTIQEGYSRD